MFETPAGSTESMLKEEALLTLGLKGDATPTEIIEAYIDLIKPYRDQMLNENYSENLMKIKEAYQFLEKSYSADTQSSMKQAREMEEDLLAGQIRKSTNEMSGNIKSGVEGLWNMFR